MRIPDMAIAATLVWVGVCLAAAAESGSGRDSIAFHLGVTDDTAAAVWSGIRAGFPEVQDFLEGADSVPGANGVRVIAGNRARLRELLDEARARGILPGDIEVFFGRHSQGCGEDTVPCFVLSRAPGIVVRNPMQVSAAADPHHDLFWRIDIAFDDATGKAFGDFTEAHLDRVLAVVHAGTVLTAPVIRSRISTHCVISGAFTRAEAVAMARSLGSPAAAPIAVPEGLRAPRHGGVYVVAHRGVHNGIPENTLAAFSRAIEFGVDFVEVDVRTSADGHLVCVHNATIDAYVQDGATGAVAAMTLAELQALDIGSRIGPEWANERIPTFEAVLALCHGKVGIYLDLKAGDGAQVLAAIGEYGMEQDVLWYAAPRILRDVAEACPACFPMPDPGPEALLPRVIEQFSPSVVAAVWRHFSPTFVAQCHAAGAIVIVDESDPSCWADALAWGADGIQTDHPEALIAFLESQETTR